MIAPKEIGLSKDSNLTRAIPVLVLFGPTTWMFAVPKWQQPGSIP